MQGSEFLDNWFGSGIVTKVNLIDIPSEFISFTLGDSMSVSKKDGERTLERNGELIMCTKEMLFEIDCTSTLINGLNTTFINVIFAATVKLQ